jgi:hypothetical protein
MRSATAPTIPSLKRERSETPLLSSIPSAESQSMLISRGGILKSKSFSQREVDLSSLATINDAKIKKTSIEADLKDAISALKKPNRLLAGQLQIEAERRAASAPTHSRSKWISCLYYVLILIFIESKKPVRNPSFQGVQIFSTPRGKRKKDPLVEKFPTSGLDLKYGNELDIIPLSSIPKVPLSAVRASSTQESAKTLLCEATPARPVSRINPVEFGTLSRAETDLSSYPLGILLEANSKNHDGFSPSPLQSKRSNRQQSLELLSSFSHAVECTPSKVVMVDATPVKQLRSDDRFKSDISRDGASMDENGSLRQLDVQQSRGNISIYKSLGWDDYDELT